MKALKLLLFNNKFESMLGGNKILKLIFNIKNNVLLYFTEFYQTVQK